MNHIKCISTSAVVAILVLAATAWGQDVTDHVPPMVQGTPFDVGGWLLRTYGPAGLAAWAAWQASRVLTSFRGIPLVVEVRVVEARKADTPKEP